MRRWGPRSWFGWLRWWHWTVLGGLTVVGKVASEAAGLGLFGNLGLVPSVALIAVPLVLQLVGRRRAAPEPPEEPAASPSTPLPPAAGLVGRDPLVEAVADRLRGQRVVLVHGPGGMGVSSVAAEAARRVVQDRHLQHYVDLRGQDQHKPDSPRRVAIQVLTELGQEQRLTRNLDAAGRTVRDTLRDSGRVLLVDNVVRADQVAWLVDHPPGAYLVVAGSFDASDLAWPAVSVEALDTSSALELTVRQDSEEHPGPSVADRISADPVAARELAEKYLGRPGSAISIGEWLAGNPRVSIRALLTDLGDQEPSSLATHIRGQLLDTASPDARVLLATLAAVPVTVLPEAAIAALADRDVARTAALLDELISHRVVERLRPARYLVPTEAKSLGRNAGSAARGGPTRLVRYYARLATDHAGALLSGGDPGAVARARRWLRREDASCLLLLGMDHPPRDAAEDLWRIADALEVWFTAEVRPTDRRDAAQAMVRAAEALGDTVALRAAHQRLAAICRASCDIAEADQHMAEARRLLGDAAERGRGSSAFHTNLGLLDLTHGRFDQAYRELRRSAQQRPRDDHVGRVADRINLGVARLGHGHLESARRWLNDALAIAEGSGDVAGQAHARELLGVVNYQQHDRGTARRLWATARVLYEQREDGIGQARCLLHEATALLADGCDPADAETMLRHSLGLRGSQDTGTGPALAHLLLGQLALRTHRPAEAHEHRDAGLAALRGWDQQIQVPGDIVAVRDRLLALTE